MSTVEHGDVIFVLVRTPVPEVYGGEQSTIATASRLPGVGFSATFVITARDRLADALDGQGLPYEVIEVVDPFAGMRAAPWAEKARRLVGLARVNAAVFRAARRGHRPIIHTTAIPGFFSGWLGGKLAGARVIYQVRGASRGSRTRWFEELAVLLADRTVTVSRSLRDQLLDTGHRWLKPALSPRIVAVYTGFDFAAIDTVLRDQSVATARASTGREPGRVHAVIVAGFSVDKGQLRFLERVLPAAVREVPSLHVSFVGGTKDAAYMAACHAAIDREGLRNSVTFAGYLPLPEVYRWYRGSDLTIIPSEREGLPRVAIESQAFGLPVVTTAAVGCAETVQDGVTGVVVSNEKIEDMVAPLVRLARDGDLRRRLGAAGTVHARAQFSWDRSLRDLSRVYRDLRA